MTDTDDTDDTDSDGTVLTIEAEGFVITSLGEVLAVPNDVDSTDETGDGSED